LANPSTGAECGATFIEKAFLEWLEAKLDGVRLVPQAVATGGHSIFEPLTKELLRRFRVLKHKFDEVPSGSVQLPREYRDSNGQIHTLDAPEEFVDGIVILSR
jgi:hypothetical protein